MLPHPQLWPAWIGAILGFALIAWLTWRLLRNWDGMAVRRRWIVLGALALFEAAYWVNVYAWLVEPNLLVVRRVEVVSEHWRGPPITIAALGDIHVGGPHVDVARVQRIVRRVNALKPDFVVLLGDYVDGHAPRHERSNREQREIAGAMASFAALDAPMGVAGVIGNHDFWYDRNAVVEALEGAGVVVLSNRHAVLRARGGDLVVAGLDDDMTGHPDLAAALDGAPAEANTIVISHSPDPLAEMSADFALMLAAHTHCGQVTIPFVGRPFLPLRHRRYACGRVDEGGKILFVTGGIGTSRIPARFLNPPEIVLITLRGEGG
ncbi:MAG: metallophosphoesterase [Terricaulis sp.]